jgi:hypothetical protein
MRRQISIYTSRKDNIKETMETVILDGNINEVEITGTIYNMDSQNFSAEVQFIFKTPTRTKDFIYKANTLASMKKILKRMQKLKGLNVTITTSYYKVYNYFNLE